MRLKKFMSLVIATAFLCCSGCMFTVKYDGLFGIKQTRRNVHEQRYDKMFREFTELRVDIEVADLGDEESFFILQAFIDGIARIIGVTKDLLETTDFGVEEEILILEEMLNRCEILISMTRPLLEMFLEEEDLEEQEQEQEENPDPDMPEEPEFPLGEDALRFSI